MRIRTLYTGGTIGMVETPHGLAPGADLEGWLAERVAPALPDDVELSHAELAPLIDSSNATPESWQAIADALRSARGDADAFVVLHGTDTMAYTAAALSYALCGFGKPVVLTGAQLPLGAAGSDAAANVEGALHAATDPRAAGVTLFFGRHLFRGNRVTKDSSWNFEAYRSPNVPALAEAGAIWQWHAGQAGEFAAARAHGWSRPEPYTRHDIAILDMTPGVSAARLRSAVDPLPEAVILRAYGVGNIPAQDPEITELLDILAGASIPIVVCSQCPQATVELGRYEMGDALARIGAVGAGDMAFEAAYAKTVFLLSQRLRGAELAAWIPRSIAGEITDAPAAAGATMGGAV